MLHVAAACIIILPGAYHGGIFSAGSINALLSIYRIISNAAAVDITKMQRAWLQSYSVFIF